MKVEDVPLKVVFVTERGKRVRLLAPGSQERKLAEEILAKRESGLSIREIARETKLSNSTIRRFITRLLLSQEVEEGVHDQEIRRFLAGYRGRRPANPSPAGDVRAVATLRQAS
jgi:response regulator of citrate/malate metabolism